MSIISYLQKKKKDIQDIVIVYPFNYRNPYFMPPPIAAEYLQAGMLATGRNAELFDMRFETDIREHLQKADLIFIYGYFEDCAIFGKWKIHVIDEILEQIPQGTPVLAGGTGFEDPDQTMTKYSKIDAVLRGNPETLIGEFLAAESFEGLKNISYRTEGGIVHSDRVIIPLSDTIYPKRELRKSHYDYQVVGVKLDMIRAGVGCNYRCKFCYQYGKEMDGQHRRWQGRSPQSLFEEIQKIEAPIIGWIDDDMTASMEALDELATLLIENKVHKLYAGTGRLDHVNKSGLESLKKLEKAGLLALSFGVESLKEKTLRFYGKGQKIEDIEKAMAMMQHTNILLFCSFIFGSPGETKEDMMDMLKFGRKWNLDTLVTNRLRVPQDSILYRAIYDKEGNYREGMERLRGRELAKIKHTVKFAQRTPFRLALSLLKLYRHKGMHLEPLYILFSAAETSIKYTWIEKTLIVPAFIKLCKWIVSLPGFRFFSRLVAIILTPPMKLLNWLFELVDNITGISTIIIPKILLFLRYNVYRKQIKKAQIKEVPNL